MIKGSYSLTVPDDVKATLTLEMTIKEWREFREQLSKNHPAWEVGSKIRELIERANKEFYIERDDRE